MRMNPLVAALLPLPEASSLSLVENASDIVISGWPPKNSILNSAPRRIVLTPFIPKAIIDPSEDIAAD